jgi:hypothetical protein
VRYPVEVRRDTTRTTRTREVCFVEVDADGEEAAKAKAERRAR